MKENDEQAKGMEIMESKVAKDESPQAKDCMSYMSWEINRCRNIFIFENVKKHKKLQGFRCAEIPKVFL